MKSNIYDIHLSEIELRLSAQAENAASTARVQLSSSIGLDTVPENFNGTHTFSSNIVNLPIGYTVKLGSHTVTTPTAPITNTSSNANFTTSAHAVILGVSGSTYVVTTTVTIEKAGESDIVLTDSLTITSVLPIAFGVKTYEAVPTLTTLDVQSNLVLNFDLTSTILGRLLVAIPTPDADMITLEDNNGNVWPVSDFTKTTNGGHEIWQLNYDTQFTGSYIKTFTIKTA